MLNRKFHGSACDYQLPGQTLMDRKMYTCKSRASGSVSARNLEDRVVGTGSLQLPRPTFRSQLTASCEQQNSHDVRR